MSVHRLILAALTALFTVGATSFAAAGCCQWGNGAPWAFAPPYAGGCGGCCGGCGGSAAPIVYAPVELTPIAPAPIYVVNQGPEYDGPGVMVPYRLWSPVTGVAFPGEYPFISGRHHWYGYARPARFAARGYVRPHSWWAHPHRPLRVRD